MARGRYKFQSPPYALKIRNGNHVKTLYFSTKAQADAYRAELRLNKARIEAQLNEEREVERKLDRLEFLVDQIIEHTLTGQGFVKRNGAWQLVTRLNRPLTKEEKSKIRSIKSRTQEFHLPPTPPSPCSLGGRAATCPP